ncbi:hypothetical protein H072_6848 [Dactylellina haptotyla CBS 200.50]|uniref:RING-type E3 ubiquitin transferase n=1 Tax=Dactylellina haptotyla (strain CBS 200.50) TaxID=1284197 RepID=S8A8P0_DACHA|nr:hypothetical protein H072_6848 [Dactylellina haptotyla CBS 200.50]
MPNSMTSGSPVVVTDIPQPENIDGYDFPFAAAPDIIRSNQKDAYFQGVILEQLSTILRSLYGARILHKFNTEAKVLADLLYLGITTLIGSRTLGEEYCDIVHVDADSRRLPNIIQRAGYIISVVILPYITSKFAPKLRARIRMNLDRRAARRALTKTTNNDDSMKERFFKFLHRNLDSISGAESLIAVHLAFFYFSGAYYHVSKRIWGMRYIFTKKLQPHEARVGYEVLGVLLLVQIVVQTYSKMSEYLSDGSEEKEDEGLAKPAVSSNIVAGDEEANVDLENPETMAFVQGEIARKCTLCLESMKDPTVINPMWPHVLLELYIRMVQEQDQEIRPITSVEDVAAFFANIPDCENPQIYAAIAHAVQNGFPLAKIEAMYTMIHECSNGNSAGIDELLQEYRRRYGRDESESEEDNETPKGFTRDGISALKFMRRKPRLYSKWQRNFPPPAPANSETTAATNPEDPDAPTTPAAAGGSAGRRRNDGEERRVPLIPVFGYIPGHQRGSQFASRTEIVSAGLHRRPMGSVHGRAMEGVYSVLITGGYREDRNIGNVIHFTGVGGTTGEVSSRAPGGRTSIDDIIQELPMNT